MNNKTKAKPSSIKPPNSTRNKNVNNKTFDFSAGTIKKKNLNANSAEREDMGILHTEENNNEDKIMSTLTNLKESPLWENNKSKEKTRTSKLNGKENYSGEVIINEDTDKKRSNMKKPINPGNKKEVKRIRDLLNDDNGNKEQQSHIDINELKNQIYNSNMNMKGKENPNGKKLDFKDYYGSNNNNAFKNVKNSIAKTSLGKIGGKNIKDILGLYDKKKGKSNKSKKIKHFFPIIFNEKNNFNDYNSIIM